MNYDRVCSYLDLEILRNNFRAIKNIVGENVKIFTSVKANAYGHGDVACGKCLEGEGVDMLCVASLTEATRLRKAGIQTGILLLAPLNPLHKEAIEEAISFNISVTVCDELLASEINTIAEKMKKNALVHIKIDTGMNRIGIEPQNFPDFIKKISIFNNIICEGIYSHLSTADDFNEKEFTEKQITDFQDIRDFAKSINRDCICHLANSAGTIHYPNARFDAIRTGILLYGYSFDENILKDLGIKPAMKLKSRIIFLKDIKKRTSVGYNRTFIADKDMKIATVSIGYGDGYPRSLSNKGAMIVNGLPAPVVGRICMDQCMIDVSGISDVNLWQEVSVYDNDYFETSIDNLAKLCGTISYELLTSISQRVERIVK